MDWLSFSSQLPRKKEDEDLKVCGELLKHVSRAYVSCSSRVQLPSVLFDLLKTYLRMENRVFVGPDISVTIAPISEEHVQQVYGTDSPGPGLHLKGVLYPGMH